MCPNANGGFEYWRAFSSNTTSACFSLIIIIVYYNIKESQWLRWLVCLLAGIGTWVRFPGPLAYFIIFSLTYSYAACPSGIYHALNAKACHMSSNSIWWPVQEFHHAPGSMGLHVILEKSKRPPSNGPKCFLLTSIFGSTTPHVCISFSLLFSFIYSF